MRPLHIFFAVMVAVLWGANFVAAKFGVAYFPPFYLSAVRFFGVAAMMVPFVPRPTFAQLRAMLPVAVMSTLQFSLLFVALSKGLDISTSTLVGQLGVPFACLLGAIFLQDRIGLWRIGGIAIAFLGIAIVAGTPNILSHRAAFLVALASTCCWGTASVLVRQLRNIPSMQLLAWMSVLVVPMLVTLSLLFDDAWPPLAQAPLSALLGLAYTAVFSTIVAYGAWYYLLSRYTVSQVTPYSLLTPVFAIAFGQMFFAERLTLHVLIGGGVTILGVAVIVVRRPKTLILGEAT